MEDKNSQEVDMIDILAKIKEYASTCIGRLCTLATYVIRLTYAYKYAFALVILAAVGLTLFYNSAGRRVYRGDATLKINAGTSYIIADLVNELNGFTENKDSKGLAEVLNISETEAEKVSFLRSFYLIAVNKDSTRTVIDYNQKYAIDDTSNVRVKDRLVISLGLKDRSLYPKMQATLAAFLNNNEYLKELYELRLSNLMQREEIINSDIAKLDSLQNKQFFQTPKNELYLTNITELRAGKQDLFYKDKQNLLDMKADLETDLAGLDGIIKVISPFHPSSKPCHSHAKVLFYIFGMLYLIFLLAATAYKYRGEIKGYLKG